MNIMNFICKIVKDCVHSDGIRDYIFIGADFSALTTLFESISKVDSFKPQPLVQRKLGEKTFLHLECRHFKVFGFARDKKVRVEFKDHHPPGSRDKLEQLFFNWI